jgi:rare lipoprotein A (peptidoglycan hydrolase)
MGEISSMMTSSQISFHSCTFNRWLFRLGSALLFLFGHLGHAQAAPRLDQEPPATLVKAPPDMVSPDMVSPDMVSPDMVSIVQQRGIASWYGRHWQGRRTASGVRFNDQALTAASLWLPFATRARVTNLKNGKSVDIVINDRGPYHAGRIIDLSARAAQVIGMKRAGIAPVLVQAVLTSRPRIVARLAMR